MTSEPIRDSLLNRFNYMQYQGKQVVVTGGAGFIGTNLVNELYERHANVTVFDLPSANFSSLSPNVKVVKGDILDRSSLHDVFANTDYVFHLAARTDLNGRNLDDYAVNHEGTRNVIEALKGNQKLVRLVVYSTQLVVGIFNETRFINPTESYRTKTIYGESKILTEKISQEFCVKFHIPYIIIRPTSVYGPFGKEPYKDYFLTLKAKRYFHIGKADNLVSMAYVKNVVDQTLFLACHEKTSGQIYFSNDFHPYTMREFSDTAAMYFGYQPKTIPDIIVYPAAYGLGILKYFGLNVPLYPFRLRNIKASYCYDLSNSIQLGFFPKYGLEDGIRETLDWYTQNDKDFMTDQKINSLRP
jgi:GlcNAc-P-P-Und epimerase